MARLSLPKLVPIGPWPPRLEKWLGPFSNTVTCQPAWASTIAANEPPAPLPITIAVVMRLHGAEELDHVGADSGVLHRVGAVGALHLVRGVAARLDVTGEADLLPAGSAAVAAVLRGAVQALDGVLEQQRGEGTDGGGGEDLVLLGLASLGEVAAG